MSWNIEQNYVQYIAPSIVEWLRGKDEPGKSFAGLVVECEFILTRHPTDLNTTLAYIERFTERPEDVASMVETVASLIESYGSMTNGAFAFEIGNYVIPVCSEDMLLEYYG